MACPTNQSKLQNIGNDLHGVRVDNMNIFNAKKVTGNLHVGTKQSVTAKIIEESNEQIGLHKLAQKIKERTSEINTEE